MDNIKSNLKGVVGSAANGIQLSQLENEYYNITCSQLNYKSLGFVTLRQFLESISDVIKIIDIGGKPVVKMAVTNNDPRCLKNLIGLVNTSSIKKQRFINRNGRQRQNDNGHNPTSLPLTISVPNANRQFLSSGNNSAENRFTRNDENDSTDNDSEEPFDSGTWFVKPVIDFEAFQKQVRILGIQSGFAVVAGARSDGDSILLQSKNIGPVFPGDITFWQPPFTAIQRTKNLIDLHTGFPVTIMKRINETKVEVRVLGLVTIFEASISDLFEMPSSAERLSQLVRTIRSREITLVRLTLISNSTNIWDNSAFSGLYTVLSSIEEGGSILESCDQRGNFLNLNLLNYQRSQMIGVNNIEEKESFIKDLSYHIDRSMDFLLPAFMKLMSEHVNVHPEKHPLRPIYSMQECTDRMLLGSKRLMSMGNNDIANDGVIILHRMQADKVTLSFFSFDDQSADISVVDKSPLKGVYIINDKFSRSTGTENDVLRFRTALLTTMPSMTDLRTDLGLTHP